MTQRTYVAITTIDGGAWNEIARGHSRATVESDAWNIMDQRTARRGWHNIYDDTERKNLRIVSLTTARRIAGKCALGECDHSHDAYDEVVLGSGSF